MPGQITEHGQPSADDVVALADPAHDHEQVPRGEHQPDQGDHEQDQEVRPVEQAGGAERADQRQQLAPEPGQSGQAQ